MAPDAVTLLWDALKAARLAMEFVRGQNFERYMADAMRRSAVERQLEIVGEALDQLCKLDPQTAWGFAELAHIIEMHNRLIHGYSAVNNQMVWDFSQVHLSPVILRLQKLLDLSPQK